MIFLYQGEDTGLKGGGEIKRKDVEDGRLQALSQGCIKYYNSPPPFAFDFLSRVAMPRVEESGGGGMDSTLYNPMKTYDRLNPVITK